MKVRFQDNNSTVEVEDEKALVDFMRSGSYTREESNKDYMLGYAKRAVISFDQDIRATSEKEFVEDLKKFNHIVVES